MLIPARLREPIERGAVTLAFRRWRRPQAVVGNRYRTAVGRVLVEAIDEVPAESITDAQAVAAGYDSADALRADLEAHYRDRPDLPLYRLRISLVAGPDPRDVLAGDADLTGDELADLDARLARLDRVAAHGPWTLATLRAIADRPGVRAPDLAAGFGRETLPFKLDVRKLKSLGLTISLRVGYRLSPRGEAYLAYRDRVDPVS